VLAFGGKKTPIFAVFWTSAFCVVACWRQSEKIELGAQLQTFPYPTVSKSFVYFFALTPSWRNGAHNL